MPSPIEQSTDYSENDAKLHTDGPRKDALPPGSVVGHKGDHDRSAWVDQVVGADLLNLEAIYRPASGKRRVVDPKATLDLRH